MTRTFRLLLAPAILVLALGLGRVAVADDPPPPPPPPPPEQIEELRMRLNTALDDFEALATDHHFESVLGQIAQTRADLAGMTDEDIQSMVDVRPQLQQLSDYVRTLDDILDGSGGSGGGGSSGVDEPTEPVEDGGAEPQQSGRLAPGKTLPSRFYEVFPRANYPTVCPNELDPDGLNASMLVFLAAKLVRDVALDGCNQLFVAVGGANASLACLVTDTIFNVAQIVFDGLLFCDSHRNMARNHAVLLDTAHLHTDIGYMQEDVDFIKDAVTCRPVAPLRRGSGCNGNDDDCDPLPPPRTIDECDEDIFPPLVYIPSAIAATWYPNGAAARQAVVDGLVAIDDCQSVTVSSPIIGVACDASTATVTATDACGNAKTVTLVLKIDDSLPQVLIPPSLEGRCFSSAAIAEATILQQAIVQDDCASRDELNVRIDSQAEGCTLRVRIQATNLAGLFDEDSIIVRVDPLPPFARVDSSVSIPWYRTTGEALAAVMAATHVEDQCQDVTVEAPTLQGSCGSIVATIHAHDACQNHVSAQALVRVDATPPAVSIPSSVNGRCFTTVEAAEAYVRSQAYVSDDCTALNDIDVRTVTAVTDCSLRVVLEATDRAGNSNSAAATVRVDASAPVVTIDRLALGFKGDPLMFQSARCFATTAAAEAAVLAATRVTDNCATGLAPVISSAGAPCSLVVTARGTDACGNTSTDAVTLRVDATAPALTTTLVTNRLTPNDKRMVDVGFAFNTSDGCGTPTAVVSVTSDESTWGGGLSPSPDAEIRWDSAGVFRGVRLRAECNVPGDGRVYKITVKSTDACGATSTATVIVNVPNATNQNVDSGQYYDAAAVN